jgi:hypothetical protein
MKIIDVYNSIINESKIEACVKKFGNELFADELGGNERNTGIENKYVDDIQDFTDNKYGEATDPDFYKTIKNLKACMQQYPEVLIPDKTKVYRGLTIPISFFINNKMVIDMEKPFPYIYKARNKVQSWSADLDAASLFGNQDMLNDLADNIDLLNYQTPEKRLNLLKIIQEKNPRIAFILEYVTNNDEFLFKSKYFRKLSKAHHEDELIRIDNKPIKVLTKFNNHEDVFIKYKSLKLIQIINKGILDCS